MQEFLQAYQVFYAANIIVYIGQPGRTFSYQLAPATNTQGYRPGCLLATVTSGPYVGQMINYDPAGAVPGQTTCTAVLIDPDLQVTIPPATVTPAVFKVAVKNGNWILNNTFLYATATNLSDVPTGMGELGGALYREYYADLGSIPVWTI